MVPSPFDVSDVVTTTTHKSLRGPRGAMIFFRKGLRRTDKKGNKIMYDIEQKINFSVFPGLQATPYHTVPCTRPGLLMSNSDLALKPARKVSISFILA